MTCARLLRLSLPFSLLFIAMLAGVALADPVTLDAVTVEPAKEAVSPFKEFLSELLMALGAALLVLVKVGIGYLVKYLREKGQSNKVFNALAVGAELVNTYVAKAEVELKPMFQSFLKDGKIDAVEGAQLKAKVLEILKRDMPGSVWSTLSSALGPAVDGWLSGKVEQAVAAQKTGEASP